METRIRRGPRGPKAPRGRKLRVYALSLAGAAALALTLTQGHRVTSVVETASDRLTKNISSRISSVLKLDQVVWEEVGSTNLSHKVTQELLWSMSDLKIGQEMLKIDLKALESRLLGVPWIESVQLQKKLPSTLHVKYTVHHARALGLKKSKLWSVSSHGSWIAPVGAESAVDLPLLVGESTVDQELLWLDTLEKELGALLHQVHEVNFAPETSKLTALIELRFTSQPLKISLVANGMPTPESINRLRRVVQYLIKNNILISTIDLRPGKKVVVNVGRSP